MREIDALWQHFKASKYKLGIGC
ncbi:hypothetical protein [Desmonostoc muscorum]